MQLKQKPEIEGRKF